MAPTSLPTCLNYSWYVTDYGYVLKGKFSSSEDVGATAPPRSGNDFTINGLVSGTVYWLQVTSADGDSSVGNQISLSGLTAVKGSVNYDYNAYGAILSGYYRVTGDPVVSITGASNVYIGFVSILLIEANIS